MLDRFHYGVCYYPEHWDASRHASDIARIAAAGFNVVRLGEGAWSYWEPQEGRYQFEMFDRVIDLCRKHKVKVIMGTPTYAGPAWVAKNYPEVLRWNFNRQPMAHGSRRNYNYTSQKYLDLSDRLVTALAEHYEGDDQILAWQLDNEFNCHMDVSYAPSDTLAFRAWCKGKYKTLEKLNDAWGTRFWSQTYDAWDQIDLPHPTATYQNPHAQLDEVRFISDTVVAFAKRQADILRAHDRKWKITHNGLFKNIDGPKLAAELDFFSHDQYPHFNNDGDWWSYAFPLQQARSLSFPYAVLEQQSGPGGQMHYLLRTPRPGQMRLYAWQSVVHGANGVLYFRWRTCPYGSEQHWHGILDQDDRDNRRLSEAVQAGKEFLALPKEFLAAKPVKAIAVLRDFDNETNEGRINTYVKEGAWESARWLHEAGRRHLSVDQVWPATDWAGYRLLVAPHMKIVTKAIAKKMTDYVTAGGTLVLGAQSGLHDDRLHIVEMPLPGLLRKLAGVEVEDWTTLSDNETRDARLASGATLPFNAFVERLRPLAATPLAWWTGSDALLGESPAVTVNRVGKGRVYYVGGYATPAAVAALLTHLTAELSLEPMAQASQSVEMIARSNGKRRYLALLNHAAGGQRVHGLLGAKIISGNGTLAKTGELRLPGYGVALVEEA
ncbi:MAG TPA: beta-galactosidase [Tepidisphaeraceae bacterium]|jgi:beta-galactosidase|nr:beta-galactosidase [Tepidisphaeraceae bacterium]